MQCPLQNHMLAKHCDSTSVTTTYRSIRTSRETHKHTHTQNTPTLYRQHTHKPTTHTHTGAGRPHTKTNLVLSASCWLRVESWLELSPEFFISSAICCSCRRVQWFGQAKHQSFSQTKDDNGAAEGYMKSRGGWGDHETKVSVSAQKPVWRFGGTLLYLSPVKGFSQ